MSSLVQAETKESSEATLSAPALAAVLPSIAPAGEHADDGWSQGWKETADQQGHQQTLHHTSSSDCGRFTCSCSTCRAAGGVHGR
jgi:predicted cobalt transporter CbtA